MIKEIEMPNIDLSTARIGDRYRSQNGTIFTFSSQENETINIIGQEYYMVGGENHGAYFCVDGSYWSDARPDRYNLVEKLELREKVEQIDLSLAKPGDKFFTRDEKVATYREQVDYYSRFKYVFEVEDDTISRYYLRTGSYLSSAMSSLDLVEKIEFSDTDINTPKNGGIMNFSIKNEENITPVYPYQYLENPLTQDDIFPGQRLHWLPREERFQCILEVVEVKDHLNGDRDVKTKVIEPGRYRIGEIHYNDIERILECCEKYKDGCASG